MKQERKIVVGDSTREHLIQAATILFAEKGYEGVSTKEICKKADANVSSLHYHFESKENLYYAVIEQFGAHAFERANKILSSPKTVEEMKIRMELYLDESFTILGSSEYVPRIILNEMNLATDRQSRLIEIFTPIRETIERFFKEAKENRLLGEDVDYGFVAYTFLKCVHGELDTQCPLNQHFKLDIRNEQQRKRLVTNTVHFFIKGIL